jgi:rubrerythrin
MPQTRSPTEENRMTLEEAIKTAIDFEIKVRDTYKEACESATDDKGRRIFQTLADEEQGHIDYLESRLGEWQKTGSITKEELTTVVPAAKVIEAGVLKLQDTVGGEPDAKYTVELEMLKKALAAEIETGAFYKRMVDELDDEGQQLFARFLEIEDGHRAIVQAEIDSVTGTGFWFDFREFDLEAM